MALGTSQTLAWASSYYLPAILANDIAAGAGVSRSGVRRICGIAALCFCRAGRWTTDRPQRRQSASGL